MFYKRKIYYLASITFIVLGLIYLVACLGQPYVGFDIKKANGQWIVITSDPHGQGYQSGIEMGDQILKIDGEEPGEYVVKKWGFPEGATTIQFRKSGTLVDQEIVIDRNLDWVTVFSEIPQAILGFVFWFLGFLTWYKRPFLEQARYYFG
jgi:two-component system sensor histidine kinase ComP